MAGNRQVYEQAMHQGTNYAWDRQWAKAVQEYRRAVAEFPREVPAHTALGQALVHAGQAQEALEVYQRAARLAPNDPDALARVAEVQEQLGDQAGAVQTWLHAADLHLRRQAVESAIQVWQHLVQVAPATLAAHERLAKAYASMDQTRKAARQYLNLAVARQEVGESEQAAEACQKALELDPRNAQVLTALDALQQGRSLIEALQTESDDAFMAASEIPSDEAGAVYNPAQMTRERALTELAGALLEDSDPTGMERTALLLQGIDCQSRGDVEAAIGNYEQALRGRRHHVATHFNLGMLYQQALRFDEAVTQFERAVDDPDYALGAHFALGECLRALGRHDEALVHFVQVLKLADLSTVGPENADELRQVYAALAYRYADSENRDDAVVFINSVGAFLSGEHWEDKLFNTRQQLNRLSDGGFISLAEVLVVSDFERILASMVKSLDYSERGMLRSAAEECMWAVEHAPDYLPLHLQLGKFFMQANRVETAIGKYLFVADTFAARDEVDQAMGLYEQVLGMAPMDLNVRHKLITLLQEHNKVDEALEHRLALADAYYELAQIESSREQYAQALDLASRLADGQSWTARILHRLGDIDLQRLDWRGAIDVYLKLKAAVPGDQKARQRLVELYLNLQRQAEAVKELDELIGFYRHRGDITKALEVIEGLVETRPEELELHKRAAQLYVEAGDKQSAISHLDAMGELQLQAGQVQEATATIKAIIALGPESAEAYRQLLEQISQ